MTATDFLPKIEEWLNSQSVLPEYLVNLLLDELNEKINSSSNLDTATLYKLLAGGSLTLFQEKEALLRPAKGDLYFFLNTIGASDGLVGTILDSSAYYVDDPSLAIGDGSGFVGMKLTDILEDHVLLGIVRARPVDEITAAALPIRLYGMAHDWAPVAPGQSDIDDWMNQQNKQYFPDEPITNYDQYSIPSWVDVSAFYNSIETFYGSEAIAIIGDRNKPVTAKYFVIHDTAGTNDPKAANLTNPEGVHLWLGVNNLVASQDWHRPGGATKVEGPYRLHGQRSLNHCFVHVELTRHKKGLALVPGVKNSGTRYTHRQYELLALAYLVCSFRRGAFLTVSIHRELDRAIKNGHNDPQDFDIGRFYKLISRMLRLQVQDGTFGVQHSRAFALKQGNQGGYINEFFPFVQGAAPFANQYGNLRRNPNGSWNHHKWPTNAPNC